MKRDRLLKYLIRDLFVVVLKDGQTFRGLLDEHDDGHLVLVNAEALTADGATKVDGRLFLPRVNVAYIQKP